MKLTSDRTSGPCPVCAEHGGFHDVHRHAEHTVPPELTWKPGQIPAFERCTDPWCRGTDRDCGLTPNQHLEAGRTFAEFDAANRPAEVVR